MQDLNLIYIPLQEMFNNAAKIHPVEYWIWDSVHPTYNGHGLIAYAWMKDTKKLFQD